MNRLIVLLIVISALIIPKTCSALTAEEVELLKRAGVSEERIKEMSREQPAGEDAVDDSGEADEQTLGSAPPKTHSVSITDWNEDGINDIIAGTNFGELNVYINRGSNERPALDDYEAVGDGSVDSGSVSVPCIVDWNGDGLKDVLMGNRNGTVFVFLNSGTNSEPVLDEEGELMYGEVDSGSYSAPAVADWNGDGKKDLIMGNFNGRLEVYLNVGTDEEPRFRDEPLELSGGTLDTSALNYSTPFAAKNYNNGLFDILTGCGDGRVYKFINAGGNGTPRFLAPQPVMVDGSVFELDGNTNVIAADWDGDGREDLLVSNRTTAQTHGAAASASLSGAEGTKRGYSKVYLLKNAGTNEDPRYDSAVEILRDSIDINL